MEELDWGGGQVETHVAYTDHHRSLTDRLYYIILHVGLQCGFFLRNSYFFIIMDALN